MPKKEALTNDREKFSHMAFNELNKQLVNLSQTHFKINRWIGFFYFAFLCTLLTAIPIEGHFSQYYGQQVD
ncbi:MAG: hypothetical protein ACFFDF_20515 [Candidatus Odinarchaeota archaeon]